MLLLRLTDTTNSNEEIALREAGVEPIIIGRDPSVSWPIPDANSEISRQHIEITPLGKRIRVKALGKNAILLQPNGAPLLQGESAILSDGEGICFGKYAIECCGNPADTSDATERKLTSPLDAFLDGAGLDASFFATVDSYELMRRAGEMYMEAVCGLCDLMAERNRLKERLALDHTTVSAEDNNPLRWGTPHRVAIDLLKCDAPGFLDGPRAFKSSIADICTHMIALAAGYAGVIASIMDRLAPMTLAGKSRLRLPLLSERQAWKNFEGEFSAIEAETKGLLPLQREFAAGYEDALHRKKTIS